MLSRRQLLTGGAGVAGVGRARPRGLQLAPDRYKQRLGLLPDPYIPDAHNGRVRLQRMRSEAMGGELDLFTAVPAGHGAGAGLPVVVVMHGSSASAADFRGFGLGRFLTRAVQRGAPPFVLAGTDDGPERLGAGRQRRPAPDAHRGAARLARGPRLRRRPSGGVGLVARRVRRPQPGRGEARAGPAQRPCSAPPCRGRRRLRRSRRRRGAAPRRVVRHRRRVLPRRARAGRASCPAGPRW